MSISVGKKQNFFTSICALQNKMKTIQQRKRSNFMFLYTIIGAILGIVLFILLSVCTKKDNDLVYNKLDKAGRIINILLTHIYVYLSPIYLILGIISYPSYDGFWGIIGWIVSIINASAALFCFLGLGLSVALRKKGKSKLSFAIQFIGVVAILLTIVMYAIFAGNLLQSIN